MNPDGIRKGKIMKAAVKVKNLTKSFGKEKVLKGISHTFEAGKIHGIMGFNGSGKTVMFKCICGFLQPDRGSVYVYGKRIGKDIDFPENTGMIIESPGFLPYISGYENLKRLAQLNRKIGDTEIRDAIARVGLDPFSKKKVGQYSLGMRERLGIAQAIMEKPRLLILDEPFNGLDVQGVKDIRELLMSLQKQGVTILLASHYDEDIRTLCEEVYLVREHRIRKKEESDGAEK